MNTENICLASEVVEISEAKTYLELTSRICYYDDTNANDVLLPSEGAEEKAQTLINMPVQALYRTNLLGEPTFSGHEMYKDENGDIQFGTQSIGTHTEVYIKNTDVDVRGEIKNLPCLYAKYRIWKRYENCVSAVRRLFSLGKLYGSWEILISSYEFKDGVKNVTDYEFLANTLLGYEYASPSYGVDAKAISLSSTNTDSLLVAEALSQDIISHGLDKNKAKEENILQNEKETQIAEETVETPVVDTPVDNTATEKDTETSTETNTNSEKSNETEISQLTEDDLRRKIREAAKQKLGTWCWIAFNFPIEKEVWIETDNRESELDLVKFTYTVENDTVTLSEPENVRLSVGISEINTKVAEMESTIASKDEAIIKAGEEITNLKTSISELTPFKEKFEQAEQERIANELNDKKEKLVSSITKSGLITKEEIESSEELKGYVDNLDDKSLKAVLADRYIASLSEVSTEVSETETKTDTTETASTNLNGLEDEEIDVKSIMNSYLGRN